MFVPQESPPLSSRRGVGGEVAKRAGIAQAERHANQVHAGWSDRAYTFLKEFISGRRSSFMTEEVREAAATFGSLPPPPSERAWGAVILRAAKAGLIKNIGYKKVKNEKAHSTPATVWQATIHG